jgi:hypothetical protein
MKKSILAGILLMFSVVCVGQTAYSGQPNFICTGNASRYPITSFAQFQCNTDNLYLNGAQVGALWFRGNVNWTQLQFNGQLAQTGTLVLDQFTDPMNGNLGTLEFHATICNSNNVCNSISVSATWQDVVRSVYKWHYPELVSSNVVVQ